MILLDLEEKPNATYSKAEHMVEKSLKLLTLKLNNELTILI